MFKVLCSIFISAYFEEFPNIIFLIFHFNCHISELLVCLLHRINLMFFILFYQTVIYLNFIWQTTFTINQYLMILINDKLIVLLGIIKPFYTIYFDSIGVQKIFF